MSSARPGTDVKKGAMPGPHGAFFRILLQGCHSRPFARAFLQAAAVCLILKT